jgi:hypothetical protein
MGPFGPQITPGFRGELSFGRSRFRQRLLLVVYLYRIQYIRQQQQLKVKILLIELPFCVVV